MNQAGQTGQVLGVILAGGRARRMADHAQGGDKALLDLAGEPLLAHVTGRLAPQVDGLILSANGDVSRYERFGLPVVTDGPYAHAGLLAGFERAQAKIL